MTKKKHGLNKKISNNGITLISLVVTIIVLIILAGVSINLVLGENGIITTATRAKEEMTIAEGKEKIQLAIAEMRIEKESKGESCTLDYISQNIEQKAKGIVLEGVKGTPAVKMYLSYKDYMYKIESNLSVADIGNINIAEEPNLEIIRDVTQTGVEQVNLTVKATVEEGDISEIVKPDGSIEYASEVTYTVTENGDYKFAAVTEKGMKEEKTVQIRNIKDTQVEEGVELLDFTSGNIGSSDGMEVTCSHIYENKYDSSNHWQQCILCNDKKTIEGHTLQTTGSDTCGSKITTSCSCGYNYSTTVNHDYKNYTSEEVIANGPNTNINQHVIAICTKCNGRIFEYCKDVSDNLINCSNRGICKTCQYDYSQTSSIVHQSTLLDSDGISYMCRHCNRKIYTENKKWTVQDTTNKLHYNLYSIVGLGEGITWNYKTLLTYSTQISIGAVTLTNATVVDLPSEYYNNSNYNTQGINSGLYLISYEATITDGYQGTVEVRLNSDKCFNIEGTTSTEYAKAWSCRFVLSPDTDAPTNLTATSHGNGQGDAYSTNVYIDVSCTDEYSDTVYVALYDENNKCIVDYITANKSGTTFTRTFNVVTESSTEKELTVKAKDRFGNIEEQKVTIGKIDTKAPALTSQKAYNDEWSLSKNIKLEVTDEGAGNVHIGLGSEADYKLATVENGKFVRSYKVIGDIYEDVVRIVYLKDGVGNEKTERITIGKLDSTSPTITNISNSNRTVTIEANDINTDLNKVGSGIKGYAMSKSKEVPSDNGFQTNNTFTITESGTYYIWVKDNAGNLSETKQIDI